MSDRIIVMNQGLIQQIGTPVDIYNEPENAFVADFIGESNIIDGVMPKDFLVEILGIPFPCVDSGFGRNELVDVVIRPEDMEFQEPGSGMLDGRVTSILFKGVHYEMKVQGWRLRVACTQHGSLSSRYGSGDLRETGKYPDHAQTDICGTGGNQYQ